jgi:hypothetical protein
MFCRCFTVKALASMNLSAQFATQLSSLRSSFPFLIEPVTHFLKHMSVREWTAIAQTKRLVTGLLRWIAPRTAIKTTRQRFRGRKIVA